MRYGVKVYNNPKIGDRHWHIFVGETKWIDNINYVYGTRDLLASQIRITNPEYEYVVEEYDQLCDTMIFVNDRSPRSVVLPDPQSSHNVEIIIEAHNSIDVMPHTNEKINGVGSYYLCANVKAKRTAISNGVNWIIS